MYQKPRLRKYGDLKSITFSREPPKQVHLSQEYLDKLDEYIKENTEKYADKEFRSS